MFYSLPALGGILVFRGCSGQPELRFFRRLFWFLLPIIIAYVDISFLSREIDKNLDVY
jgi:hypothetical protein